MLKLCDCAVIKLNYRSDKMHSQTNIYLLNVIYSFMTPVKAAVKQRANKHHFIWIRALVRGLQIDCRCSCSCTFLVPRPLQDTHTFRGVVMVRAKVHPSGFPLYLPPWRPWALSRCYLPLVGESGNDTSAHCWCQNTVELFRWLNMILNFNHTNLHQESTTEQAGQIDLWLQLFAVCWQSRRPHSDITAL